jgi:hypothetical protein
MLAYGIASVEKLQAVWTEVEAEVEATYQFDAGEADPASVTNFVVSS